VGAQRGQEDLPRDPDRAEEDLSAEHDLFAACAPGLEPLLAGELRGLGAGALKPEAGGVAFRGDLSEVLRANLWLRTASRVLLRLGEFHARDFEQLRRRAGRLPFGMVIAPGRAVRITVSCSRSRLRHTGAVAQRVRQAISDQLGSDVLGSESGKTAQRPRSEPQASEVLILVRLVHDRCTVSIDSSGELLHQRGWRKRAGKAPLRETLAAALLLDSDWDRESPLADPFCGSGTIPIEAALLARNLAPGRGRRFACQDWPDFGSGLASRTFAEAQSAARPSAPAISGSDRDAGAIQAAAANSEAAGVGRNIVFARRAISDFEPPSGTGWLVCNPPYGVRLRGGGDLRDLYASLGAVLRRRCPGWRVVLLCSDARLVRASGLPLEPGARWRNGGLAVSVYAGRVPDAA
jgi:putative N6-adenine-specific DNA methylase